MLVVYSTIHDTAPVAGETNAVNVKKCILAFFRAIMFSFLITELICSVFSSNGLQSVRSIPASKVTAAKLIVGVNYWEYTNESLFANRDAPLLRDAGIRYVRLGPIAPQDMNECDALVDSLWRNGVDIVGTFSDEPDFGNYVYELVYHYRGKIRAWIVLNEANDVGYANNVTGYVNQLKTAYLEAKKADPSISILTTNLLSTGSLAYLDEMYRDGAKDYFDVLAVDPYCVGVSPLEPSEDEWGHSFWDLTKFHNLMSKYGDGEKKVWIIEMGWRTPDSYGWFYTGDGKGTVTEQDQTLYIHQAINLAATWPWVERFYLYEWMDCHDPEIGYYGLIRETYNPPGEAKPAYYVVKDYIQINS